jgi:PAS domain-containing protein
MTDGHPSLQRSRPVLTDPGLADRTRAGEMALVLVESLAEPVYVIDRAFRILFANDAFVQHMGMPRDELMGAVIWDRILPRA